MQFEKYVLQDTYEINSISNSENWNYISNNLNEANDLTKCVNLVKFNNNHFWFNTLEFLYHNDKNYVFTDKNKTIVTNNQIVQTVPPVIKNLIKITYHNGVDINRGRN